MVISLCKWFFPVIFQFLPGESQDFSKAAHPFYVSVVEINYNGKNKELEISCKVFTNDFETTLQKFVNAKIDLADTKSKAASDKAIAAYISKHLQIKLDDQLLTLQFVGAENEAEATWSYFQAENISAVKKIDITDTMLYESYEAQINIIHVSVNGMRKSTKLGNPDSHASFEF